MLSFARKRLMRPGTTMLRAARPNPSGWAGQRFRPVAGAGPWAPRPAGNHIPQAVSFLLLLIVAIEHRSFRLTHLVRVLRTRSG